MKLWILQKQGMNLPWNKQILKLYLKDYIFRIHHFLAETTLKLNNLHLNNISYLSSLFNHFCYMLKFYTFVLFFSLQLRVLQCLISLVWSEFNQEKHEASYTNQLKKCINIIGDATDLKPWLKRMSISEYNSNCLAFHYWATFPRLS